MNKQIDHLPLILTEDVQCLLPLTQEKFDALEYCQFEILMNSASTKRFPLGSSIRLAPVELVETTRLISRLLKKSILTCIYYSLPFLISESVRLIFFLKFISTHLYSNSHQIKQHKVWVMFS